MDEVATELLGAESQWPESNTLKVSYVTLNYSSLHKIAMTNWWPTVHYCTISSDFGKASFLMLEQESR